MKHPEVSPGRGTVERPFELNQEWETGESDVDLWCFAHFRCQFTNGSRFYRDRGLEKTRAPEAPKISSKDCRLARANWTAEDGCPTFNEEVIELASAGCSRDSFPGYSGDLCQQVRHVLAGIDISIDVRVARTIRVHDQDLQLLAGFLRHVR